MQPRGTTRKQPTKTREDRAVLKQKIPFATKDFVSKIYSDYYTWDEINEIFHNASVLNKLSNANDLRAYIRIGLNEINRSCPNPLEILGQILEAFMDQHIDQDTYNGEKITKQQERIKDVLSADGLYYERGGYILSNDMLPVLLLLEHVSKKELTSSKIELEIKRIIKEIESDPSSAIHRAGSLLEAVFKDYLDKQGSERNESQDKISDLWQGVVERMEIKPGNLIDENLKKISSGLYKIVDGAMHMRNKASSAHGRSEKEEKENTINSYQAKLVVNAAATLSAYVLGSLEK